MCIDYDLTRASVIEILMMIDPFALMVVITLIFATVEASVRVCIKIVLTFFLFHALRDLLSTFRVNSSFVNIEPEAVMESFLDLNIFEIVMIWLHFQD